MTDLHDTPPPISFQDEFHHIHSKLGRIPRFNEAHLGALVDGIEAWQEAKNADGRAVVVELREAIEYLIEHGDFFGHPR